MTAQATISLPSPVYEQAEQYAQLTGRGLSELVADIVAMSLPASDQITDLLPAVSTLSDQQVLALSELELDQNDDQRLSRLLQQQQAGTLQGAGRIELSRLMQLYQAGLLRKAEALAEAVKRGLRPPLSA